EPVVFLPLAQVRPDGDDHVVAEHDRIGQDGAEVIAILRARWERVHGVAEKSPLLASLGPDLVTIRVEEPALRSGRAIAAAVAPVGWLVPFHRERAAMWGRPGVRRGIVLAALPRPWLRGVRRGPLLQRAIRLARQPRLAIRALGRIQAVALLHQRAGLISPDARAPLERLAVAVAWHRRWLETLAAAVPPVQDAVERITNRAAHRTGLCFPVRPVTGPVGVVYVNDM